MASVDKEGNNLQRRRKPLQLISIKNGSLELNSETLKTLQRQIPENNQVAIVGIAGSPKSGKSLLANYIIEYFENHQHPGYNWLKTWENTNDPKYLDLIDKGEDERETFEHFPVALIGPLLPDIDKILLPGVYCWVIQQPVEKGDSRLSILVLDIHSPDNLSLCNIYGALVDYVFLTSSLVIYLDNFEHWNCKNSKNQVLWSPGSSSIKGFHEKYFQNCHYILRGWNNPTSFVFGSRGGSDFCNAHLRNEESPFHLQIHEIKSYLQPHFSDFTFHLLPKSQAEYSKILKESSKDYIKYLTMFVKKELDVEDISPVKSKSKNDEIVTMAALEKFLRYPTHVIFVPKYNNNVDLPHIDEKMDANVHSLTSTLSEQVKTVEYFPCTNNLESSNSNSSYCPKGEIEPEVKTNKMFPDSTKFYPVEQNEEPMEVDSEPPKPTESKQEPDNCPAIDHTKTTQENAVLEMIENEFKAPIKILESSKYFIYPNLKDEDAKIIANLKACFPTFFTRKKWTMKLNAEYSKQSNIMQKLNNENKKRQIEAEYKINSLFESLCKSEFQRMKQTAQKSVPEPFHWTADMDKLSNHFDFFLKSLVTSSSPSFDLEFQKQCQETCKHKIENLCKVTNFSSLVVNKYCQQMQIELDRLVCIDTESDFTQLHENTSSHAFKSFRKSWPTDFQKGVLSSLDDHIASIILDYKKRFHAENSQIQKEEAKIAEQAMDFAIEKYKQFMNKETTQGGGIFKKSEISDFHKEAYDKIKVCFHSISDFTFTYSWKMSWKRLDQKMKELEKDYQNKIAEKMEKNKRQRKLSFATAENEYTKLMNGKISTQGLGKSLSQEHIEKFHEEAKETALKLYETKMKDVAEDTKNFKEALIQTFLKIRENLILENDEKLANELERKEEAKANDEYHKRVEKMDTDTDDNDQQQQQQRRSHKENSNSPIKIKSENPYLEQNMPVFRGGIAIHFSHSGVHVGSYQNEAGFHTILQGIPPFIAFTPQGVLIGEKAHSLSADGKPSLEFTKHDLFQLVQTDNNDAQKLVMHTIVNHLRTEEILAIFLHQLSTRIADVHPNFHHSSCHVEFVISPFLQLPAKHMIKNALNLAGFSKAHILQSTSAMALTYFNCHRDKLEQNKDPYFTVAIHSSPSTFDIVLSSGLCHKITSLRQTGLPYIEKPGIIRRGMNFAQGFLIKSENGHAKVLAGILKSVIRDGRLKTTDIQKVILVAGAHNSDQMLQKVVEEVFKCQFPVLDECEGILQGAAAYAAWKAEVPTFSQRFRLDEIRPYFLTAQFDRQCGGDFNYSLVSRHDPCVSQANIQIFKVPQGVSRFSNKISIKEENCNTEWTWAEFIAGCEIKKETIVGKKLQFEISPEGVINVQWPSDSPLTHQLPIKSKHLWLNQQEVESAKRKLDKIFSMMTGSSMYSKFDSLTTPQSPSTYSASFSPASLSMSATHQGGDFTHGHANSQTWRQNQADGGGDREFDKARKELESFAKEVKGRLDNSQNTSALVRGQIEDLLKEVEGVLSKSSESEADLLKSYMQKLEIRAKRIK